MKTQLILLFVCASALAAETNQPPRAALEISAEFGRFQLKENTAYYSNNVVVKDPPSKPGDPPTLIYCRELTATRSATGKMDTIVAVGTVKIDQGDKHALADRAVYYGTNETMELTGGFDAQNLRPVLYSSQFTNYGDRIVYDRSADTLSIQAVRTEISGASLKNSGTNSANTNKVKSPKQTPPKL
jgi:lipopolysaccharide assembly outer membrane protein LptD (OstA)